MLEIATMSLTGSGFPEGTRIAGLQGEESISRPYAIDVFLVVPGADFDPAAAIGESACVALTPPGTAEPHRFSGTVVSVGILQEVEGGALVRATLVPRLWTLGLSLHSRVFVKQSIVQIIEAVFAEAGLTAYELRLGSYAEEAHVCQYRESDLAFLSRWMEREGIYYYFAHGESGETLILCDGAAYESEKEGKPVRFFGDAEGQRLPGLRRFQSRHATLAASIRLRDYDYAKPELDVAGTAVVSATGVGEFSLHGERFFSPDDAARLATLRAEEMRTRASLYEARGDRLHLRPGTSFELEHHPRSTFNAKYLVIEARHAARTNAVADLLNGLLDLPAGETYAVEVCAIPEATQFRPPRSTPWPRIFGYERGVVDGPADTVYAQIDEDGRYAIKLAFDESDLAGGGASTSLRMMQPHGGATEGFHFPLRKNTEVLVAFLGGDPDRPVIAGVVPNAHTPSAVTSANHTKNVIQTGGRNRLELEDQEGKEQIILSTPHADTFVAMGDPRAEDELEIHTAKNGFMNVGANMFLDVGIESGAGELAVTVRDLYTTAVEVGNYEVFVDAGTYETEVYGDSSFKVTDGNWQQDIVKGTWTTNVEGDTTWTIKSGATKLDTLTGRTDILSKDAIKIESADATLDLLAKGVINIKSSTADVNIEGINVNTTSTGDWSWTVLGDTTTLSVGMTNEIALSVENKLSASLTNDFSLALKTELSAGGSNSAEIALAMSIFLGAKIEMEASLAYSVNASIALGMSAFEAKDAVAWIKKSTTVDLTMGGLFVVG